MKKVMGMMLLVCLVIALSSVFAGEKKTSVIVGELVDVKCYAAMGKHGEEHKACAIDCAKMGIPVGVVDENTGTAYVLLAPAPDLAEHQARRVRVTGKVLHNPQSILPTKLEVEKEGKWEEVKLPESMMMEEQGKEKTEAPRYR